MASRDALLRPLDAAGQPIRNLGVPTVAGDATFTDLASVPRPSSVTGSPGTSLLAAPADHAHPSPAPLRVLAKGKTVVAANARVTLATFKRKPNEVIPPGGFAFIPDDKDGVTWENEVDGATHIALYHERTGTGDEVRFKAVNGSDKARTVEWATVALLVG
jgi:hypothetical protein